MNIRSHHWPMFQYDMQRSQGMGKYSLTFWCILTETLRSVQTLGILSSRSQKHSNSNASENEELLLFSTEKSFSSCQRMWVLQKLCHQPLISRSTPTGSPMRSYTPSSWSPCPLQAYTTSWVGKQKEQLCQNTRTIITVSQGVHSGLAPRTLMWNEDTGTKPHPLPLSNVHLTVIPNYILNTI